MQPVFSIITVSYNAHEVIEDTIVSVLKQNYPNIEYIIIDGASTDGTLDIVEKYRGQIAKIVSEKDEGIYDAMNKGLAMATGDYVWFMNTGDYIYTTCTVSKIVEDLKGDILPDIIYGETAIVNQKREYLYMRRLKAPQKLYWKKFANGMLVSHQAFIVKRTIAPMFDMRYRFSADYDWCIRCMKISSIIQNSHLVLANYLNEGATTQNMKASLKERFAIMCRYYGKIPVYLQHIKFILRFAWAKLKGKV